MYYSSWYRLHHFVFKLFVFKQLLLFRKECWKSWSMKKKILLLQGLPAYFKPNLQLLDVYIYYIIGLLLVTGIYFGWFNWPIDFVWTLDLSVKIYLFQNLICFYIHQLFYSRYWPGYASREWWSPNTLKSRRSSCILYHWTFSTIYF